MNSVMEDLTGLTWDEFLALPDETRHCSLVDGTVIVNPPNTPHQLVVRNLVYAFDSWRRAAPGRGQTTMEHPVKASERTGYLPDVCWFPEDQYSSGDEPTLHGVPRLVVEVLSPSTRRLDLVRKRADFGTIGIDEVWYVDHYERTVLVCRRVDGTDQYAEERFGKGDVLTSPLLDGFTLPVDELFDF